MNGVSGDTAELSSAQHRHSLSGITTAPNGTQELRGITVARDLPVYPLALLLVTLVTDGMDAVMLLRHPPQPGQLTERHPTKT